MPLRRDRVALNPIQWGNAPQDAADPKTDFVWRYDDPAFAEEYPQILRRIKESGFPAVMLEVLPAQTLQGYERMIRDAGLLVAPGYVSIGIPSDHAVSLPHGSAARLRWFDGVRRRAEESSYTGLRSVLLAPEVSWEPQFPRTVAAAALGVAFSQARLDEQIEFLAEAADVLAAEGVRAGLHNHVGTWIETEEEIEQVLAAIPADRLGASFDIGHLEWAGIDATAMLRRHAERLLDLHLKDLDLGVAAHSRNNPAPYDETARQGLFREPGTGQIDLDAVIGALPEGHDGWVIIEVDRTLLDPFESARISWSWVSTRLTDR
jgi:sugar phosphate isomerase/epimerase